MEELSQVHCRNVFNVAGSDLVGLDYYWTGFRRTGFGWTGFAVSKIWTGLDLEALLLERQCTLPN